MFCYSIGAGSKDPAKAMTMLNEIMTSTELMNLLNWGVEGEDYVVNADGLLDFPEGKDASTVGYHLNAGWILPNQFKCTPWCTSPADIYDPREDRVLRLMARDGISREYAEKRLDAQHSEEWFREHCDYLLENTGNLPDFQAKCLEFLREHCIMESEFHEKGDII